MIEFNLKSRAALECARRYIMYLLKFTLLFSLQFAIPPVFRGV